MQPPFHRLIGFLLTAAIACSLFACRPHEKETTVILNDQRTGKPEIVLLYDGQGHLTRLERDSNGDGRMDWIDEYQFDAQTGSEWLAASRVDLDGDHRFETVVRHQERDHIVAVERDRNGDGKIDVEAEFNFDFISPESGHVRRDDNFDGEFEINGASLSIL